MQVLFEKAVDIDANALHTEHRVAHKMFRYTIPSFGAHPYAPHAIYYCTKMVHSLDPTYNTKTQTSK